MGLILAILRDQRATTPRRETPLAAGYNLYACLPEHRPELYIDPFSVEAIPTGLEFRFPQGTYGRLTNTTYNVYIRRVIVADIPVDPDNVAEIFVYLYNPTASRVCVRHGDCVAQMVVTPFDQKQIYVVTKEAGEEVLAPQAVREYRYENETALEGRNLPPHQRLGAQAVAPQVSNSVSRVVPEGQAEADPSDHQWV